jgi:hypothetical protein
MRAKFSDCWKEDAKLFVKNNHIIISIACASLNNPLDRRERFFILLCTLSFSFAMSVALRNTMEGSEAIPFGKSLIYITIPVLLLTSALKYIFQLDYYLHGCCGGCGDTVAKVASTIAKGFICVLALGCAWFSYLGLQPDLVTPDQANAAVRLFVTGNLSSYIVWFIMNIPKFYLKWHAEAKLEKDPQYRPSFLFKIIIGGPHSTK